jgi:hypothetical protein
MCGNEGIALVAPQKSLCRRIFPGTPGTEETEGRAMFQIARQVEGGGGSFVKLVQLDSDDFAVIVRYPSEGKLYHQYMGPDFNAAEEIFDREVKKIASMEDLHTSGQWEIQ